MATNKLIDWFRQATPYINSHRGKTFVIMLSGDAVADDHIHNLIHDIVVLQSLGIRLVIIHGMRKQLDLALASKNISSDFVAGQRVTDTATLDTSIQVCSLIRSRLERKLSMGLPNSPMHGAKLKVASANVITARPAGVIDGIDLLHTGVIRKVDAEAIHNLLDMDNVILLSPIGYSPTGEAFNLPFQNLAAKIAIDIKADKLIAFTELPELKDSQGKLISELTPSQAESVLQQKNIDQTSELGIVIKSCNDAVNHNVSRAHIMSHMIDGALLNELFSVDGEGLLIQKQHFETIRQATEDDIPAILDIIRPLEHAGVLVRRDRDKIEDEISCFSVITREGLTVAVAALYIDSGGESAEIACITTHPDYRGNTKGGTLLKHLESKARAEGIQQIFVLTTQTTHWFLEQGFTLGDISDLPNEKQHLYNYQRNSKVLLKHL